MDNERIWARSLEVMDENFGHVSEISLGSTADGEVVVRDVHSYYIDGKMYILSKANNVLMHHISKCPNVGMSHGAHKMQGVARSLGHPLDPANADLRKKLKREFSLNYDEYVTEANPDMRIVEIALTKAQTFTRHHRYNIDFVNKLAERDHTEPLFVYRH